MILMAEAQTPIILTNNKLIAMFIIPDQNEVFATASVFFNAIYIPPTKDIIILKKEPITNGGI